ncbi:MAG: glycosyltransferase [Calditrichaeota bacterium]|nr:glycosyltransferase [Calditrichota bacterium]
MKAKKKVESGKQDSIFLSIVIPAYNSKAWLPQCLDSIKEQVNRPEVEVIIVDSSEEDVTPFINERYPFVRTFHLPERAFPGTARTFGISKAKGEVIAFIDTDCEANDAWIANIINSQRNGRNVVGGPVANGTPDSLIGTSEYLLEFSEMAPAMPEGDVRFIPTCNISFKKSVFDQIGKIEDTIKGSDALFCRRIHLLGEPIYFNHGIVVRHHNRRSFRKVLQNQYDIGVGAAQVRVKEDQVGSILVKLPFLIPLIPFARTLLICRRFLKHDFGLFLQFVALYPLIFVGLVAYTAGFWKGYRTAPKNKK